MPTLKIIWSNQAKSALKIIFDYYKEKSTKGARNVKNDILKAPKALRFAEQYQIDEINPNYRRIVVRNYKFPYKTEKSQIIILDIVSTKQSPHILENK